MSSEEDLSVQLTQSTLGKYVTKPNLSEKLLKKPPFRFLHDIVCVVISETGYLKGLFSDDALVSANVKEREAKVAFLNKLITAVKTTTKSDLKVRASKVIAGLEPIETNKLLQTIAKAIEENIDSSNYVNSLTGAAKNKAAKSSKTSKVKETRSVGKSSTRSDKAKTTSKEPPSSNRSTSKTSVAEKKVRDKKTVEKKSSSKDSIPSTDRKEQSRHSRNDKDKKSKPPRNNDNLKTEKETKLNIDTIEEVQNVLEENTKIELPVNNLIELNKHAEKIANSNISEKSGSIDKVDEIGNAQVLTDIKGHFERPKTAKISTNMSQLIIENQTVAKQDSIDTKSTSNLESRPSEMLILESNTTEPTPVKSAVIAPQNRPRSSLHPPSARPGTARPAAPRLRPPSALPPSDVATSNGLAGNNGGGNVKVVVEQYGAGKEIEDEEDDEEETVVVQQNFEDFPPIMSVQNDISATTDAAVAAASKSHLVGQIMAQVDQDGSGSGVVQGSKQVLVQLFQDKPVAELGASIQTVTQSANTLGQLMGYLHEDIDAMRAELEHWSQVARSTMAAADKRRSELAERTRPLRSKLQEVEEEIQRHKQEIATFQCTIHNDHGRIESLLRREVAGVGEGGAVPMYD